MTLAYLPEHAENALLALKLAIKEGVHLDYTHRTLFAHPIDLEWVQSLEKREELAEKLDAFVSRFGRLQDQLGEKLIPRFAQLLGGTPKSLLDNLVYAEKMGWIENAEEFIGTRKLRNLLVHEYMVDAALFLQSLHMASKATQLLLDVISNIKNHAEALAISVK